MGLHSAAWRLVAGDDQPGKPGLPCAELLAPVPIALLAILFVNDWIFKPSELPRWLTGKLSDFAGLAVFPLVATAAFDLVLVLAWRLGARVDFTLRRWKLATAIALTGGVFTVMKLVPAIAHAIARVLSIVTGHARVMPDPTDLLALPALAFAWWFGCRTLARGAYGRLAWAAHARPEHVYPEASPELDAAARAWLAGGPDEPLPHPLARARARPHRRRNFLQRSSWRRCRTYMRMDGVGELSRPAAGSVDGWVRAAIVLAMLATFGVLAAGPHTAWTRYDAEDVPGFWFRNALAIGFVTAMVVVWLPPLRASRFVRFAVALPIVQLVAMIAAWLAWRAVRDDMPNAVESAPLLRALPVHVIVPALVLGVAVAGAIVARPRKREWLHATAMFALVHLLLLGLWLPIAAHRWWNGDGWEQWIRVEASLGTPANMVGLVLVPPFVAALIVTGVVLRRPALLRNAYVHVALGVALLVAVGHRMEASEAAALVYINFIHVLAAAAVAAVAALVALGATSWLAAARARRALTASTLAGTIAARPDDTVAALEIGWLRGPATHAHAFTVETPHGAVPVPAGADVCAPTPLASTVLRGGEVVAILRGGDRVALAGYERGGDDGPFRASAAPVPGAAGVRVGRIDAERYGLHHVALDLWRPSVAYLVICVAVAAPALAALLSNRV
jgi:hypothetical protein